MNYNESRNRASAYNGWGKFAKLVGAKINKPFWVNEESDEKFIITEKGVGYVNPNKTIDYDIVLITYFIEGIYTVSDYPPSETEVFILDAGEEKGYYRSEFMNNSWEKLLYDRGIVFIDEEEIKEHVKDMGWV
jgi:anaerobic selenocysteine-containing dehydrogenase